MIFILKNRQLVPWRDGYEKILSVNVVDSATVVLRFAEPYPHAIQLFPFVLPAHAARTWRMYASKTSTVCRWGQGLMY